MKVAQLEREKIRIAEEIKEKDLIRKCREVALLGKNVLNYERDCSTHVVWEYGSRNDFFVSYESGIYAMGDGERIHVYSSGWNVFKVSDKSTLSRDGESLVIDDKYVETYILGDWTERLDGFLKEIPEDVVDLFRKRFSSANLKGK